MLFVITVKMMQYMYFVTTGQFYTGLCNNYHKSCLQERYDIKRDPLYLVIVLEKKVGMAWDYGVIKLLS